MSMKFLLYVKGQPLVNGFKRLEFEWSQPHGLYLFRGRPLDASELNADCEKVFTSLVYKNMFPCVKIAPESRQDPVHAPVEVTLAEAEAVMKRLAPHRLKGKPGPKEADLVTA